MKNYFIDLFKGFFSKSGFKYVCFWIFVITFVSAVVWSCIQIRNSEFLQHLLGFSSMAIGAFFFIYYLFIHPFYEIGHEKRLEAEKALKKEKLKKIELSSKNLE